MGKNKINIGNCGEYFVAAELERRDFSVAVPMSNTELFDILAFDRSTHKQWAIQVKTTTGEKNEWTLSKKNETIKDENIVYVFVKLNNLRPPEYYIVPSEVVAEYVQDNHQKWLNTPGEKGQQRNDNKMRKFADANQEYLDKCDCLN